MVVAPITRIARPYRENVELPEAVGSVTGYALCGQLFTVNQNQLRDFQGHINSITQSQVDGALHSALGLTCS